MSRMQFAFTLVLLSCFTTPLFAQQPRAEQNVAHIKLIEAAFNLITEMLKASEAAYQQQEREFNFKLKIAELEFKLKDLVLVQQAALKANHRLVEEILLLEQAIIGRQKLIVKLETDLKTSRISAVTFEAQAKVLRVQNENLQDQIRELTRELAKGLGKRPVDPDRPNPNEPNPPAVLAQGKIEKIDAVDGTLITISLGIDHGVNKNHTLDVYRTQPEAKYLGMIRIVESYQHKSVARLIGNPAARPQLKVGDSVTSKFAK